MKTHSCMILAIALSLICGCSDDNSKIEVQGEPTDPESCQGENCSKPGGEEQPVTKPGKSEKPSPEPEEPEDPIEPEPENPCGPGVDIQTDNEHCGACDNACVNATCQAGVCVCDEGFLDCKTNFYFSILFKSS